MESKWYVTYSDGDLMHHGVKGMRWGVRRYQNADGTYNAKGRMRYGLDSKNSDNLRKNGYSDDDIVRLKRNTRLASMLGGPIAGVIAGNVTNNNIKKRNSK